MKKDIKNFELSVGDIAMSKVSRNKTPYIEVAYLKNPNLRALYAFETCEFVSGNIPERDIPYITDKVKRNKRFLGKG